MTVLTTELSTSFDDSMTDVDRRPRCRPSATPPTSSSSSSDVRCSPTSGCAWAAPTDPQPGRLVHGDGHRRTVDRRPRQGWGRERLSAVCQHRACRCRDGGNGTTFTCPYHQWSYGSTVGCWRAGDGTDRRLHKSDRDFPTCGRDLARVRVRQPRSGGAAGADAGALRAVPPALRPAERVCPGSFTLTDLPWNWKVMFENFNDGYHANRLHHSCRTSARATSPRSRSRGTTPPT